MYWLDWKREFDPASCNAPECVCLCVCLLVAVSMVEVERPRQLLGLGGKHAAAIFTFVAASVHSCCDAAETLVLQPKTTFELASPTKNTHGSGGSAQQVPVLILAD